MNESLYRNIKLVLQNFDEIAGEGKPVCLFITGADLAILAALRQPSVPVRIEHMAKGKAYTCARMGCSTAALHQRLITEHLSLADFMDTGLTTMRGGVPFLAEDGSIIAGIGVSGRLPEEDEAIALKILEILSA
jgi:uncharacterized protein GlcG (DUF336 family)